MKYIPSIPGVASKIQCALVAAVLFFIVGHPMTYKIVDSVLGGVLGAIASASGAPTTWGLVVHSAVFGVAAYYLIV